MDLGAAGVILAAAVPAIGRVLAVTCGGTGRLSHMRLWSPMDQANERLQQLQEDCPSEFAVSNKTTVCGGFGVGNKKNVTLKNLTLTNPTTNPNGYGLHVEGEEASVEMRDVSVKELALAP